MREYALAALHQIESAPLTAQQYRTARRLLDHVAADGMLHIDATTAQRICDTVSPNTMRAHLIALRNAGIISYAINHQVHIGFLAWPVIAARSNSRVARSNLITTRSDADDGDMIRSWDDQIRAPHDQNGSCHDQAEPDDPMTRSPHDQIRAPGDQIRACHDQIRAPHDHLGGTIGGVGWLDLPTSPSLEKADQPTNPERRNPIEEARSVALLAAVGIMPRNAKRLAEAHPFEHIQRAIAHWWDGKGMRFAATPGIVVSWLDDWENAGVPVELSRQFRQSDLYRRHRQGDEPITDDGPPAPQPIAAPPPPAADTDYAALWAGIVAEYPLPTQQLLRQAQLVGITGGTATIQAPPSAAQWIGLQLRRPLARKFATYRQDVNEVEVRHA